MFSPDTAVRSAHGTKGAATISGGTYNKWSLVFSTTQGCAGEAAATVEIETPLITSAAPIGEIPLRAAQDTIAATPSAYLTYAGATLISGTVTVDAVDDYFSGSMTAQVTIGGVPTDITATFDAPMCQ